MTDDSRSGLSRRAILGLGAAGVAAPLLAWAGIRTASRAGALPFMEATRAEALASSFGVVTHFHFANTAYGQSQRVVDTLTDLGVRHIRNRIALLPAVHTSFRQLAERGIEIQGVCGALGDPQTMQTIMDEVVRSYADPTRVFSAFEDINEPNNDGIPWIAETRAKTKELFDERGAHSLERIPIVGPALARVTSGGVEGNDTGEQSALLGDLTPWIDRGNIHVYPRALTPSTDLDQFIGWQRQVCGDKPIVNTEGGFFTAVNYSGGSDPSTEESARQYVPRQVMENWIRGIERFFLYELLDDPDGTKSSREASFGMLRVTNAGPTGQWTPKPHYLAMKNFLDILGDPGPSFRPDGLACSVSGGGPELRSALVQKRDGKHYLCIWRDINIYDPDTRQTTAVSSAKVTVRLAQVADISEYRPSTQAVPFKFHPQVSSFDVDVEGELHICEIF